MSKKTSEHQEPKTCSPKNDTKIEIAVRLEELSVLSYLNGNVLVKRESEHSVPQSNEIVMGRCCATSSAPLDTGLEYEGLSGENCPHDHWQTKLVFGTRSYGAISDSKRKKYINLVRQFHTSWTSMIPLQIDYFDGEKEAATSHSVQYLVPPLLFQHKVFHGENARSIELVLVTKYEPTTLQKMDLIICFGGKDQMGLDWLHTVSKLLVQDYNTRIVRDIASRVASLPNDCDIELYTNNRTMYLLMEYPGYGFTRPGVVMNRENFRSGVMKSVDQIKSLYAGVKFQMHFLGYSMGCSFALDCINHLTNQGSGAIMSLTLMAPFDSVLNVATQSGWLRWLGKPLLAKIIHGDILWDNVSLGKLLILSLKRARRVQKLAVCIMSGGRDTICPSNMGDDLVKEAFANKEEVSLYRTVLPSENHCSLPNSMDAVREIMRLINATR